jgi:hypothetical protein
MRSIVQEAAGSVNATRGSYFLARCDELHFMIEWPWPRRVALWQGSQ